jgi:hypothetical protein
MGGRRYCPRAVPAYWAPSFNPRVGRQAVFLAQQVARICLRRGRSVRLAHRMHADEHGHVRGTTDLPNGYGMFPNHAPRTPHAGNRPAGGAGDRRIRPICCSVRTTARRLPRFSTCRRTNQPSSDEPPFSRAIASCAGRRSGSPRTSGSYAFAPASPNVRSATRSGSTHRSSHGSSARIQRSALPSERAPAQSSAPTSECSCIGNEQP